MGLPASIPCDECKTYSRVIEWKIGQNPASLGAVIECPKCGEREQWIDAPGEAEDFTGMDLRA